MRRTRVVTAAILGAALVAAACSGAGDVSDGDAQIGKNAPRFSLASAQGDRISLNDYLGQRPVLLYFSMGPG